jgi:hypothetical protein
MSANKVQTPAEIQRIMETGRKIVPDQWKSVESFDDVDEDEYESDEEVGADFQTTTVLPDTFNGCNKEQWTDSESGIIHRA